VVDKNGQQRIQPHLKLVQGQLPREVDVDHLEAALRGCLAVGAGQIAKVAAGGRSRTKWF